MEKMDLVRKVTAKKVGHDRKGDGKKSFAPMDKLYQRLRKVRTNLNSLDSALNKSIKEMIKIIELQLVGKSPTKQMMEMSKIIDWVRNKGKGAVEQGVEVLIEIEKEIKEESNKLQEEEGEKMVGINLTDGSKVNRASRLYKYASKDDEHIYREMDDLMKAI